MKIWLFALLQSVIASLGLVAFFWAENVQLATSAAVLAASLGIAQPLISASKGRKLKVYHTQQQQQSLDAVDGQLKELLQDVIDPPLPHRATVAIALQQRFHGQADELLPLYDRAAHSITERSSESENLALQFADAVKPWSVGAYLQGLAALNSGDVPGAQQFFCAARERQGNWILPWLGWATTAYRQDNWSEIRTDHPHVNGVELMPFGAGDEATFVELTEDDREDLASAFQSVATSLGSYYTIAEFCHSKQQIAAAHDAYSKVA